MRYLSLSELLFLHRAVRDRLGIHPALHSLDALLAAQAAPRQAFDGQELYPTLVAKTAALGFALMQDHPFREGNEAIGHLAMSLFLHLNGHRLAASELDTERMLHGICSSKIGRNDLSVWLSAHIRLTREGGRNGHGAV